MFDAPTWPPALSSRRAFLRGASKAAAVALLASPVAGAALAGAGSRALAETLGSRPPPLLGALELATYVPPLFQFPPSRFSAEAGETYVLVSFGNSNSLDTWQGIRHQSSAQRFAERMSAAGRGRWRVFKNYAHAGDTELQVDAQATRRRTVQELRSFKNLAVFLDPCGDDFKHNLATPAQISSLRGFLSDVSSGGLIWPAGIGQAPSGLLGRVEDAQREAAYIGREAAYVASSVARDVAGIAENTYRLLDDIQRLYGPAFIFWTNAANYGYARFFSLGEDTSKRFSLDGPIARRFATNVAAAVNNQSYMGIKRFLSHWGHEAPAFVYIDAFHHITPAQLSDGPHYNDAGVELLAGLAAQCFV